MAFILCIVFFFYKKNELKIVERKQTSHHVNAMTRYLLYNNLRQQVMVPDFTKTILHVDTVSNYKGLKMKFQLKLKDTGVYKSN
jgi:hypothetical protein